MAAEADVHSLALAAGMQPAAFPYHTQETVKCSLADKLILL